MCSDDEDGATKITPRLDGQNTPVLEEISSSKEKDTISKQMYLQPDIVEAFDTHENPVCVNISR